MKQFQGSAIKMLWASKAINQQKKKHLLLTIMNLERSRAIPTTVFAHLTTEQLTSKLVSYLPEIKQSPESFMKKETHHFSRTFLNQRAKKETTDAHQNF